MRQLSVVQEWAWLCWLTPECGGERRLETRLGRKVGVLRSGVFLALL